MASRFDEDSFNNGSFSSRPPGEERLFQHGPKNVDALKTTSKERNLNDMDDYEAILFFEQLVNKMRESIDVRKKKRDLEKMQREVKEMVSVDQISLEDIING